jgi:AcrR family transcriptional regulator
MRILDAATAVFRERGYERSTIAAIAASAGVAD